MTREEILASWEDTYGELSASQRAAFLGRPELGLLEQHAEGTVLFVLGECQRLADAVELAHRVGWWFDGDPCGEDGIEWCGRCRPSHLPSVVYVTSGRSRTFHRSERCRAMEHGRQLVERQGGDAAPVVAVALQVALGQGREPCLVCLG